jgi:hypothetical protein
VIGVYLRYNFRARLDDGRNPATAAGLAVAIEELAQSGTVGWIRLGDVQAAGRIVCLPGDERRVRNILAHRFGELVDLKLISQVASPAPGLDRLFVLGPRKPKPRASADRAATGTDRKVGSRPRIVMRVAGIDHHGVITGWVYCSRLETPSGFSASVNVDGRNLGTVPADRFDLAALRAGLRDGECAFSFRLPAELLDGEEHTVSIMGADREGIFANKVVKLVFPKRVEPPSRPWRDIPTAASRSSISRTGSSREACRPRRLPKYVRRSRPIHISSSSTWGLPRRLGAPATDFPPSVIAWSGASRRVIVRPSFTSSVPGSSRLPSARRGE